MDAGGEEDEEIRELRAEIARLEAELEEEMARPLPQDEDNKELLELWNTFPFGDVGQGVLPECRRRRGPLRAIWRAYFEHTMPGGLKSSALLRFAARTDAELVRAYPSARCDWHEKLLEISMVLYPAAYDRVKTEALDAKSMNMVHNGLFQYDTKLGYPGYPLRVQEQEVYYLGGAYGPNMTEAAAKRTLRPGTKELFDWKSLDAEKPVRIAQLRSAHLACDRLGDAQTPHERLADERAADYAEVIRPYRDYHLNPLLEGNRLSFASGSRTGTMLPLYPVQSPVLRFKPNKLSRATHFVGGWLAQVQGSSSEGVVSLCMIPDLLPCLQPPESKSLFEGSDLCGVFMQCRGWLRPHAEAEVILFSDEARRNQMFILCNAGSEQPAVSGFVKHAPRRGDLYQHEVLLATEGADYLLAFARGGRDLQTSPAVLAAVDLSDVKRL